MNRGVVELDKPEIVWIKAIPKDKINGFTILSNKIDSLQIEQTPLLKLGIELSEEETEVLLDIISEYLEFDTPRTLYTKLQEFLNSIRN